VANGQRFGLGTGLPKFRIEFLPHLIRPIALQWLCAYMPHITRGRELTQKTRRLKHFRVAAGMTQTKVAEAVGITQPTYQRWEVGSIDIPEAKLAKLAKVLGTTNETLLGRHPPVMAALYDDSAPADLQYYGEVAIHFHSGSEPLLLSISEEVRSRLYRNLHLDPKFVTVKDLGNRTVAIRKSAISDLYLSSEAYDDYGPEHDEPGYKEGTPLQFPDPRDWEIIECLSCDSEGIENFGEEDVERVTEAVMVTDQQYTKLVADGCIKPEELEAEKVKNAAATNEIFEMATSVIYQLSTGKRRCVDVTNCNLIEAFGDLVDDGGENFDEGSSILLQSAGYHRSVFINPDAVDYISIPTHLLERSSDETSAEMLDELGDNDEGYKIKRRPRGKQKVTSITEGTNKKNGK
jgi:transcriptional regulator with XRE-family HTH domain